MKKHFILFVQVLVTDSKHCSLWNLSKLPISCSSSRLGRRMATIKRQTMTNCSWWVIHNYTKKKITITNKCQWQRIGQFFLARQLWIFASIFICLLSFSKQIRPAFENFVQTIDSEEKVSTQTPSTDHYQARLSQYRHIWSQINSTLIDFEADVSIIGAIAKKMLTDGLTILTDHHNNRNNS